MKKFFTKKEKEPCWCTSLMHLPGEYKFHQDIKNDPVMRLAVLRGKA